jgi:hypothetical protein
VPELWRLATARVVRTALPDPPSTAKTVDATNDEPVVVDGPFVEAPEYVGGFWVIEAADQDAAVQWATQASKALGGRIEVRAFQDPQDA